MPTSSYANYPKLIPPVLEQKKYIMYRHILRTSSESMLTKCWVKRFNVCCYFWQSRYTKKSVELAEAILSVSQHEYVVSTLFHLTRQVIESSIYSGPISWAHIEKKPKLEICSLHELPRKSVKISCGKHNDFRLTMSSENIP